MLLVLLIPLVLLVLDGVGVSGVGDTGVGVTGVGVTGVGVTGVVITGAEAVLTIKVFSFIMCKVTYCRTIHRLDLLSVLTHRNLERHLD